ncbi:thymidylate kinase-domain-containing protein [Calycina marina]|uniref:Thymidylate kinase n=1 Tax=Calycina marina TaxID=1763456 RepID=A0A9P7YU57_9HELO|nr:thymidylate kinase-domain-containing protein [Calycina marina]
MSEDPYPYRTPSTPIARGAFIVIEGLDRSGKTTQGKLLADALYSSGHNVRQTRFPDRTTPIGQMISTYLTSSSSTTLSDQAIHLLFSANRWEAAPSILSSLQQGTTIICDRYTHSGAIYSAAKHNPALPFHWAWSPDVGLPAPDLVVFLDVSPENAAKRGGFGDERYETREMQEWVRSFFVTMAAFGEEDGDMVIVPAGKEISDVANVVLDKVLPKVEVVEKSGSEVGKIEGRDSNGERSFMMNVRMMYETLGYSKDKGQEQIEYVAP